MNSKIFGIFPEPIYMSELNRALTKEELSFIDKIKLDSHENYGNTTSNDTYILNNKEFKDLKKELHLKVKDYFNKVLSSSDNITPYITQSWLNYTEKNQYHHKHYHSNSLISGVFYINSNEEFDKIKFFNEKYKAIQTEVKEWNLWNSETWNFSIKSGDVILFPSSLTHMVETKQGNNTRISLAFNVFIKGALGEDKKLNKLIL
jgi:uncharacterized protein (TIGR02466 family)